mmetsp:Transcript_50721/g.90621  ORF Transcript_50721/g.90621 Transcript_50721/m.90621 type:complete len:88 (+) Transcript_50721:202-465(+)
MAEGHRVPSLAHIWVFDLIKHIHVGNAGAPPTPPIMINEITMSGPQGAVTPNGDPLGYYTHTVVGAPQASPNRRQCPSKQAMGKRPC